MAPNHHRTDAAADKRTLGAAASQRPTGETCDGHLKRFTLTATLMAVTIQNDRSHMCRISRADEAEGRVP